MMPTRFPLHCFAALLLALPTLATAQFQSPTQEELQMTSDPKAPGAAAVFLSINEVANDPLHFHSVYARIKVLTEKGKELATVEVPYEKGFMRVADIRARTIHPDGTIVSLVTKPEDLLIAGKGEEQVKQTVFTLPSVEVGSILEYFFEVQYDERFFSSPHWQIQRPFYVHKSHYEFTPAPMFQPRASSMSREYLIDERGYRVNRLVWQSVLPKGATIKQNVNGLFSLDISDIEPRPMEEWMLPDRSQETKVDFYYKNSYDESQFWTAETKYWSKEVDTFAEVSKAIRDAVNAIISPEDSEIEKAKKLYKAVQALDNTDFSRKKTESEMKALKLKTAKKAEEILAQKSGSGEDIALLFLAMAHAAGLNAQAMRLADREETMFDPTYLFRGQLNQTIISLTIGGKEILADPGQKMCPFGMVHWKHSGASGFNQSMDGQRIATTPEQLSSDNKLTRFGELTLDKIGGVTGSLRFVMTGQEALRWRQAALRNSEEEVKRQFDLWILAMMPGSVEAHVDHFIGIDNPDVNLAAIMNLHGSLGTATGKRVLLAGYFFENRGQRPFVNEAKRTMVVDMHYAQTIADQVTYHLPEGMIVEGAPQDGRIGWEGHALLVTRVIPSPGQIVLARTLVQGFTFAKPSEYQDLRGFYLKLGASDQQQLVLNDSAPVKAN